MKLFTLIFTLSITAFPTFAQETIPSQTQPKETELLFSDDLYVELLNAMRKRYASKDISTLNLRKKELEKILRKRSSLDNKTRQRLEIEWIVIQENLMRPIIAN